LQVFVFMNKVDAKNLETYLQRIPFLRQSLSKQDLDDLDEKHELSMSLDINNLDGEIWVEFKNTNGLYSISNFGRIKRNKIPQTIGSRKRINTGVPEKILRRTTRKGYLYCMISVLNKRKTFRIHREVAIHFIENPQNLPMINHKNGIRHDNRLDNLEWCNNSHNQVQSFLKNGRVHHRPLLGKTGYACFNSKTVCQFTKDGEYIREWGSASEASRQLNIFSSSISFCCIGRYKTAGGFIWKYKSDL